MYGVSYWVKRAGPTPFQEIWIVPLPGPCGHDTGEDRVVRTDCRCCSTRASKVLGGQDSPAWCRAGKSPRNGVMLRAVQSQGGGRAASWLPSQPTGASVSFISCGFPASPVWDTHPSWPFWATPQFREGAASKYLGEAYVDGGKLEQGNGA